MSCVVPGTYTSFALGDRLCGKLDLGCRCSFAVRLPVGCNAVMTRATNKKVHGESIEATTVDASCLHHRVGSWKTRAPVIDTDTSRDDALRSVQHV